MEVKKLPVLRTFTENRHSREARVFQTEKGNKVQIVSESDDQCRKDGIKEWKLLWNIMEHIGNIVILENKLRSSSNGGRIDKDKRSYTEELKKVAR